MENEKSDIFERVTRHIVEAIQAGAEKFRMPWHVTESDRFAPVNAASNKPYRGVNVVVLWVLAERFGYPALRVRVLRGRARRTAEECPCNESSGEPWFWS